MLLWDVLLKVVLEHREGTVLLLEGSWGSDRDADSETSSAPKVYCDLKRCKVLYRETGRGVRKSLGDCMSGAFDRVVE
jgi:hypothetical protein